MLQLPADRFARDIESLSHLQKLVHQMYMNRFNLALDRIGRPGDSSSALLSGLRESCAALQASATLQMVDDLMDSMESKVDDSRSGVGTQASRVAPCLLDLAAECDTIRRTFLADLSGVSLVVLSAEQIDYLSRRPDEVFGRAAWNALPE